jgi:hypothetical protein
MQLARERAYDGEQFGFACALIGSGLHGGIDSGLHETKLVIMGMCDVDSDQLEDRTGPGPGMTLSPAGCIGYVVPTA